MRFNSAKDLSFEIEDTVDVFKIGHDGLQWADYGRSASGFWFRL